MKRRDMGVKWKAAWQGWVEHGVILYVISIRKLSSDEKVDMRKASSTITFLVCDKSSPSTSAKRSEIPARSTRKSHNGPHLRN